uniref:Uncharacterized protein n=1 Tax=Aegilops tauschii subsp. strangulata TaxID=200361 RepID=A0A453H5V5_AEGTS
TGDPLDFLGQIHAACKRQRPLGTTQRATRILLPRGEGPAKAGTSPSVRQSSGGMAMQKQSGVLTASRLQKVSPDQKDVNAGAGVLASNQNDMLTTPSMLSTITDGHNQIAGQNDQQKNEMNMFVDRNKSSLDVSSSRITSRNASVAVGFKKDQFYSVGDSHLTSQAGDNYHVAQAAHDQGGKHQKLELAGASVEMDVKCLNVQWNHLQLYRVVSLPNSKKLQCHQVLVIGILKTIRFLIQRTKLPLAMEVCHPKAKGYLLMNNLRLPRMGVLRKQTGIRRSAEKRVMILNISLR